jgi:hypothetical protein
MAAVALAALAAADAVADAALVATQVKKHHIE